MTGRESAGKVGRRARELFLSGHNCAESVLLSNAEQLGFKSDIVPAIASGFGGGIARTGMVCGAISGATIAAGFRFGRGTYEEDRDALYAVVSSFVRSFAFTFGGTGCRELIGYRLSDPEESKAARESGVFDTRCAVFVEFSSETIFNLLSGT